MRQLRSLPVLGLLCLACAAPADPPAPPPEDPTVLARFRGGEVRIAELDTYLEQRTAGGDPQASEHTSGPTGTEDRTPDGEARAQHPRVRPLREIAVDKALAAEAAAWTDPQLTARVDAAIERAKAGVLLQEMMERRGWADPELSEEELRAYFEAHPEFYDQPRRARLQHIYLRAEGSVMTAAEREQVRQRLEAIRQEAVGGADFVALVRQHSESATATAGGYMTLDATTPVPREFAAEVWSLEVNGISEVVDAGNGFHLIKLNQIFEPARRSFEESLDHLRRKAGQARVWDLQEQLLREVGPRYNLERHYERLQQADPDNGGDTVLVSSGDGDVFTLNDLLPELHQAFQEQLFQGYTQDVRRVLDQFAANRMLLFEARDQKLEEDQKVAGKLAESAAKLRAEAALQLRLEAAVAAVPETELRDYFEQNRDRYQTLRTYDLTLIHLESRPGESFWQTLKRGEGLVARIRGGEDMEALAREHSRHYSAGAGGRIRELTDTGLRSRIQATAKFRRRLEALSPGEVTEPFLSECYDPPRLTYVRTGVYIVRLDALNEPVQKSFEDMADAVSQNYLRRNHQHLSAAARQQVAEKIDLEIFADRLPPI